MGAQSKLDPDGAPAQSSRAGASVYFLSPPESPADPEPPPDEFELFGPSEVLDEPPPAVEEVPGFGNEPPDVDVKPPGKEFTPPDANELLGNDGFGRFGNPPEGIDRPPDGSPLDVVEIPPEVPGVSFDVVIDFGGSTGAGSLEASPAGSELEALGAIAGPTAPEDADEPDVVNCPGIDVPPFGTGATTGPTEATGWLMPAAPLGAGAEDAGATEAGAATGIPDTTGAGSGGTTPAAGRPGATGWAELGFTPTGLTAGLLTTPLSTTGS